MNTNYVLLFEGLQSGQVMSVLSQTWELLDLNFFVFCLAEENGRRLHLHWQGLDPQLCGDVLTPRTCRCSGQSSQRLWGRSTVYYLQLHKFPKGGRRRQTLRWTPDWAPKDPKAPLFWNSRWPGSPTPPVDVQSYSVYLNLWIPYESQYHTNHGVQKVCYYLNWIESNLLSNLLCNSTVSYATCGLNVMLRHSLSGAVIFLTLQHFIVPAFDF